MSHGGATLEPAVFALRERSLDYRIPRFDTGVKSHPEQVDFSDRSLSRPARSSIEDFPGHQGSDSRIDHGVEAVGLDERSRLSPQWQRWPGPRETRRSLAWSRRQDARPLYSCGESLSLKKKIASLTAGEAIAARAAPPCVRRMAGVFSCAAFGGAAGTGGAGSMIQDSGRVVVTAGDRSSVSCHCFVVYHRDFPEVRAEGESPQAAADRLAVLLSRTLDNAPSDWRRESLGRAIEDVRVMAALSKSGAGTTPDRHDPAH